MTKTKIITTLGPATKSIGAIKNLIQAGADIFRVNMSHGDYSSAGELIHNARSAIKEHDVHVPIFMDLRGPKIRIRKVENNEIILKEGNKITISTEDIVGTSSKISTDYTALPSDVKKGNTILLDDGQIVLTVESVFNDEVVCIINIGGVLKSNKGLALPGITVHIPSLTDKDIKDVQFGIEQQVDGFMLSFVQKKEDVLELQGVMRAHGGKLPVFSKIETVSALNNLQDIASVSDALLVARGDLGVELPMWQLPSAQKKIIKTAHEARIPAIVATEMLESMIQKNRPTRAEVSDVANAVYDGADITMLSAETAAGKYPAKAVDIMNLIACEAEKHIKLEPFSIPEGKTSIPEGVARAAVELASMLKAQAIILYTVSGFTARITSFFSPQIPIYAFTSHSTTARFCNIYRGVVPFILEKEPETFDEFVKNAVELLAEENMLSAGDTIIATNVNNTSQYRKSNAIKVYTL